ncbi:MAG: hypothetical protein KGQ59_10795 [Bdellovibrionales bacterium]|nr:hypothetical protein [Bdellovibrionales bacterium]
MTAFLATGISLVGIVSSVAFGSAVPAQPKPHSGPNCIGDGFLPPNQAKVPISATGNGMTEAKFNAIIDRVEKYYKPIVAAKGANLVFQRLWSDSTVNAFAERSGSEWRVKMYGGLARHSAITDDAFALIACHEVGHHLGGAPKYRGQWAANEGQADYFATLKCMRDVFGSDDNRAIAASLNPPQALIRSCEGSFGDANAIALCQRSGMAGLSAAELMRVLSNDSTISFTTPDPNQVSDTSDSHPAAQCRLDTYSAGAVCQVASSEPVSETDATVGTCSSEKNFKIGVRPRCWYKPAGSTPDPNPTPTPTPSPTPTPPVPGGIARKPTMGGSEAVSVANPNAPVFIDADVSEFSGAGGVYLEISRANQDFSNPNSTLPDKSHLRAASLRGKKVRFYLVPAQALTGRGTYYLRVIPLNAAGTQAVGRASSSSRLVLNR